MKLVQLLRLGWAAGIAGLLVLGAAGLLALTARGRAVRT